MPSVHKRLNTGNILIEGPDAIFPPEDVDDFGWLEPELVVVLRSPNEFRASVAVFTDNTVNRNANFLAPMIRHVHWNTREDLSSNRVWPSLDYGLGFINDWNKVKRIGREIQRALLNPPFVVYGHSRTRSSANVDAEEAGRSFWVRSSNGVQTVEFHSPVLVADTLSSTVLRAVQGLLDEQTAIDASRWSEKYSKPPFAVDGVSSWRWTIGSEFVAGWSPGT